MPTTNHAVVVTIDGVDRSSSLLYDALSVRVGVGNSGNVADLQVVESAGYIPQAWDEVLVTVDGTRIFGGYVATRTAQGVAAGSSRTVQWSLACRDWSMLLDKIIVSDQFVGTTDAAIVTSLFNDYLAGNGFTLTEVQFTREFFSIGFDRTTLRQALNKLAEQVGAGWYIDPLKRVYWYNRWSPLRAAFDIDTVAPNNTTTFDVLAGSFRRSIDDTKAINRVQVFGKDVQGTLRTQTFTAAAAGAQVEFGPVDYPLHSIVSIDATFTVLGAITLQGESIGYEPDAILYGTTNADVTRLRAVVVNREKRTVKITTVSGVPVASTSVVVNYYEMAPITVTVDDTDLQGLHERILTQQVYDPTIADEEQAAYYGRYLLNLYGRGPETVTFDVPEYGLLPGSEIYIYSPTLGIDPVVSQADMLLQDSYHRLSEAGDKLLQESYGISAISLLKLESGDGRLLESGSYRRLETVRDTGSYIVQEVSYRTVHTPTGWMMVASVTAGEQQQTLIDIVASLSGGAGVAAQPTSQLHGRISDIATNLGEVVAGRAVFTDGGAGVFNWGTPNSHTGVVVGLDDSTSTPAGALYIYDTGTTRLKLGKLDGLAAVGTATPTGWGIWTTNGFFQGQVAASVVWGGTVTGAVISGGTVTGNTISGGTITGALVTAGTVSGALVTAGTVSGNTISGGTVTGARVTAGTVSGNTISGGTVTGAVVTAGTVTGNTISGGTVTGALVTAGTVSGNTISGGTVTGARVTAGTVSGNTISGGTVTGAVVTAGTVSGNTISGGTVTGALVSGGTVSGAEVSVASGTAVFNDYGLSLVRAGGTALSPSAIAWYAPGGFVAGNLAAKIVAWDYSSTNVLDLASSIVTISGQLQVASSGLFYGDLIPDASSSNRGLGDAQHGWKYLYLFDGADEWRLQINSSGVVTATKV